MKILVSSAHYHLCDKYGGETKISVDILNAYAEAGHKVYAVAGVLELENSLHDNVEVFYRDNQRSKHPFVEIVRKALYPIYSYFLTRKIYNSLKGEVDIVHRIAPLGYASYDLFFIFKPKNTHAKFIIGPNMPPPLKGDKKTFYKFLSTSEKSVFSGLLYRLVHFFVPILNKLYILTLNKADKVYAVSTETKEILSKDMPLEKVEIALIGLESEKLLKIGNERLKKFGEQNEKKIKILAASVFIHRKGLDVLLKAFSKMSNKGKCELVLVGDGPEKESLIEIARELEIFESIVFPGYITLDELVQYYKSSDIYCSPTRYEPYGMSVIEAMACGLPVVVTNVNAMEDIVGEDGFLFKKDSVDELAKILQNLSTEKELRISYGKRGVKRVETKFNWQNIIKIYCDK